MSCDSKLYRKRQVLGKVQSACGVFEPLAAADGILRVEVGQDSSPEVDMNERNIAFQYLSKLPNVPGAVKGKISFTSEIVGSGDLSIRPESAEYFLGCGYREIVLRRFPIKQVPVISNINKDDVITSIGGAGGRVVVPVTERSTHIYYELLDVQDFVLDEQISITGGASNVAQVGAAPSAGGFSYKPTSEGNKLMTIKSEEDGSVKYMFNAMGTVSLAAEASGIGKLSWEFMGVVDKKALEASASTPVGALIPQGTYMYTTSNKVVMLLRDYDSGTAGYEDPLFIDVSGVAADTDVFLNQAGDAGFTLASTPVGKFFGDEDMTDDIPYFTTVPGVLQDAENKWGSFEPVFGSVSFDAANEVVTRVNANSHTGLIAAKINDRKPAGTIDPDMVSTADYDFYNSWFKGDLNTLQLKFGGDSGEGNTQWLFVKYAQAQNVPDNDKEGTAAVGYEFEAKGYTDDDHEWVFI